MTSEIAQEEADFMSVFNNSERRHRRNGLFNIFDGLEEEEKISFLNRLVNSSSATTDENGEFVFCTAMDAPVASPDTNCCYPRKDAHSPGTDHFDEERDRLSGLTVESSPPPSSMETARPSCLSLVGLKSSSNSSSSSSSTSPSSMSSQTSSSASSNFSTSSSSSSREGKLQTCSPDDNTSTTQEGFTRSPSTSSICYDIAFSRVRRNALHDLFETLTQDDLEKLKNLYQTALSTAYSLKPFSEQTQSPIRGFHECKA